MKQIIFVVFPHKNISCQNMIHKFLHQMETLKKIWALVGYSNHWATGDYMVNKGEMWVFD